MRKLTIWLVAVAAATAVATAATSAYATPNRSSSCSNCHGTDQAVTVTATEVSNDGVNATYMVLVANPYGAAGWAVLRGTTNLAYGYASSGTFTVPVGSTYTVWGASVGGNEGARSVSISPVAPVPTPVPEPEPTPTPEPAPVPAPEPTPTPTASVVTVRTQAGARVELRSADSDLRFAVRANAEGVAVFQDVPLGEYRLGIRVRGDRRYRSTVQVDEALELIELTARFSLLDSDDDDRHERAWKSLVRYYRYGIDRD